MLSLYGQLLEQLNVASLSFLQCYSLSVLYFGKTNDDDDDDYGESRSYK